MEVSHAFNKSSSQLLFCFYCFLFHSNVRFITWKKNFTFNISWCGSDFDGLLVFDECHKAKNFREDDASGTKIGIKLKFVSIKIVFPVFCRACCGWYSGWYQKYSFYFSNLSDSLTKSSRCLLLRHWRYGHCFIVNS